MLTNVIIGGTVISISKAKPTIELWAHLFSGEQIVKKVGTNFGAIGHLSGSVYYL